MTDASDVAANVSTGGFHTFWVDANQAFAQGAALYFVMLAVIFALVTYNRVASWRMGKMLKRRDDAQENEIRELQRKEGECSDRVARMQNRLAICAGLLVANSGGKRAQLPPSFVEYMTDFERDIEPGTLGKLLGGLTILDAGAKS